MCTAILMAEWITALGLVARIVVGQAAMRTVMRLQGDTMKAVVLAGIPVLAVPEASQVRRCAGVNRLGEAANGECHNRDKRREMSRAVLGFQAPFICSWRSGCLPC